MQNLFSIKDSIDKQLLLNDRQILVNECKSITTFFTGDGNGLLSGSLVEQVIKDFFLTRIKNFKCYNHKESDFMIDNVSFSFKKISNKASIALDWSKNKTSNRIYFTSDIIVYVMNTSQWWKKIITITKLYIQDYILLIKKIVKKLNF